MNNALVAWMICIPLVASPLIYFFGRIGLLVMQRAAGEGAGLSSRRPAPMVRSLALITLLLTWIPFVQGFQEFNASGPLTLQIGSVPLRMDGISFLLTAVALGLGSLVTLFSAPYMRAEPGEEKYYAMLVAMVGVMIALGSAADLFNLWVWFEAMAVSTYLLVVFYREEAASLEAGVKYVIQSAAGSIMILLGIALILAQTGSVTLDGVRQSATASPVFLAAGALFVIGFGVKVALVPLHTWLPDAHTQAPSGISAMLSGVVIEAGLIALLRSLSSLAGITDPGHSPATWGFLLMLFAAVNMLVGNLMALRQTQVKRLLAYSSLSHMGYIVLGVGIALYAGQAAGAQGSLFHLLNHGLMKGLAFLAAGALLFAINRMGQPATAASHSAHGPLTLTDLNGAAQRYPLAALAFSLAVLGLGGLPPLAGFMSKWQIFLSGFTAHNAIAAGFVIFAALNSVLSLGYYAPLVNAVYRKQPSAAIQQGTPIPWSMSLTLILLSAAVVLIGFYPPLIAWLTGPAGNSFMTAFGR